MLSNQQNRQQQSGRPLASRLINHERQRSTPTTPLLNLESTGCFPERYTQGFLQQQQQPKPQQRQAPTHHRRGLSLDPSMRLQELRLTNTRSPLGNNGMITTNQGPIYQQQKMRETQIPGPARPGQIEHSFGNTIQNSEMIHDICADFGMAIPLNDNVTSCYAPMIVPSGVPNHETPQIRPYTPNNLRMNFTPTSFSNIPYSQGGDFTQSSPIRHGSIDFGLQPTQMHPTMTRGGSYQGDFPMKRSESQNSAPSSMSNTNTLVSLLPISSLPLDFTNLGNLDFEFPKYETEYGESLSRSPAQTSPAESSMRASPDLPPVALFGEVVGGYNHLLASEDNSVPSSPTKSRSSSPRKKVAPLPEDMVIEDTGITSEQVDAFIQGPDPQTNKFTCLFEGCTMKPTGRKENIRAHVQTHLGDRKYVCTVCDSRFVRPNDLKRHAIIHQEVKEYICKCGSEFGRQDALRRHRIRKPFCVDGDPSLELMRKEEKKRGRPKKIAPTETTERRERKENIRKQVMERKRKGSLPCSVTSTSKSGRSCSPDDNQRYGSVSAYSPTNMSLTPPMSPSTQTYPLENNYSYSAPHISSSPPPTRDSMTGKMSQDFGVGDESPFGADHFSSDPFSGPATPPQTSSSPYGTPPELEISSSPAVSRFTLDLSDPILSECARTMVEGFGSNTIAPANFSDEFLSESLLMDQMLKGCTTGEVQDGIRNESMEEIERFLMLDQM